MHAQLQQLVIKKLLSEESQEGFSLIELVVVVAVLAVLAGIGLPFYNRIQERAADTLVRVSMRNSFMECKTQIAAGELVPAFTLDLGLASTNGFYQFYQQKRFL